MVGDPHGGSGADGTGGADGESRSGSAGSGRVDRRRFISLAGAAAATALSGCSSESDDDGEPTTAGRQRDVDGPVMSVMTGVQPSTLDVGPNTSTPYGRPHFEGFLQSLVLPTHGPSGEPHTSGHTWSADGTELSVPCAVAAYEVTDDGAVAVTFDDRLTYWNGDPLDARAYHVRDRIEWLEVNGAFTEDEFTADLVGETEYRWTPMGGPINPTAARTALHPGPPPLPTAFNEPWLERFEDASSREQVRSTYLDYRQGKLSIETYVEEGYGTGRYAPRSTDDVTSELVEVPYSLRTNTEVVYAEPREDYPGPTDRPTLRILGGAKGFSGPALDPAGSGSAGGGGVDAGTFYDPRDFVDGEEVDAGTGVIAESKGDFFRAQVPDAIEQADTWANPAAGGKQLVFNWERPHLRRLWVRRAVAAAAPFERMRYNQYGPGTMPPSSHSGLLGSTARRALGSEFVDSLYQYPQATDTDLAAEWLRRAGYERVAGGWQSPDGDPLSLTLTVYSADINEVQTLIAGLESFGVAVETEQLLGKGISFEDSVRKGGFDLLLGNVPAGQAAVPVYGDWFSAGDGWVAMPPIAVAGNPLGSCRDDPPVASVPESVTLPDRPGALTVDGVDYPDGGAIYEFEGPGETVALCEEVERLRDAETDEAGFREAARRCARWYNYALPNAVFVQDRVGLWADLERFAVAADEERSTEMARGEPVAPMHYHVQAGTLRER